MKIMTIVQSRDAYRKATDAAEWNGGQYDGSASAGSRDEWPEHGRIHAADAGS
jgi:hypothetical protein